MSPRAAKVGDWEALSAFPIVTNRWGNPAHESLPFEIYRNLKNSIEENEFQSPYTIGLLSAIIHIPLTQI